MSITVRRATAADAELLSSLNAEVQAIHAAALPAWFKPPGPQAAAATATLVSNPANLIFVAEVDAAPAGYVYASLSRHAETPWRHAYEMIYIHQIGVRAAHRRQGVGAALLAAVRAEAASRNVALLGLDVWSFNADAQAFFRRQGFPPYQERMLSNTSEAGGKAREESNGRPARGSRTGRVRGRGRRGSARG
jgi:ribosomal protein S18 acetylase RimI-like enzyme